MTNKTSIHLLAALCAVAAMTIFAADKQHLAGPKGGRFLERTAPKAEFFLEKDRHATIYFYDASLKPVPVTTQSVTVVAETPGGKQTIPFERKTDTLVSTQPLPDGEDYTVVVQFRSTAESKSQNHRFKLQTHTCGGCHRAEYACTCDE